MSSQPVVSEPPAHYLPTIARTFVELGYEAATLRQMAQACRTDVAALRVHWPDKSSAFIAALEYAYEAAEQTWTLLLLPDPPLEAAERLLAYVAPIGQDFTVERIFSVGLDAADEPRIRATLRRLNRRLARFLAQAVTDRHIAALAGEGTEDALRSQAGVVLRDLARVQQTADATAADRRQAMIGQLAEAVSQAKANTTGQTENTGN